MALGSTLAMAPAPIPFEPMARLQATPFQASESEPEPVRLSVALTWMNRRCVLLMTGDLDADTSVALESVFEQLIGSGFDEVVLDVGELRHLDESGAVALAKLWTQLRDDGVICRVRGLPPMFADSPLELLIHVRELDPVRCTLGA